jgi:hypothetical protein
MKKVEHDLQDLLQKLTLIHENSKAVYVVPLSKSEMAQAIAAVRAALEMERLG